MFKKQKWAAFFLAGAMGVSAITPLVPPTTAHAATYSKTDGSYRMLDGTAINGVTARGIDVSHWKGVIDWNAVAADDIQFVMLGTTYGGGIDPNFRVNAEGASKAGLKVGAYLYSYADDIQTASDEADFILDLIKDYPISYPIAFDAESSKLGARSPQEVSEIINTFCKKIEDAGYHPMVYANDYWLANKIDLSTMPYDVWVARYEIKHSFPNPVMWQATQTGSINGVNGNVDINFQYKDFSDKLPPSLWRTIADKTYYYQDYTMQRNNWIHDGTGWFHMGPDAQTMKGWQIIDGSYYYLDDMNGQMSTDWLLQNDIWYYLGTSGAMATGWTDVDGSRYYLDASGAMQTGWHIAGDIDYYLTPSSGKMTIGWKEIDGSWYYFNPEGQKQTGWQDDNGQTYHLGTDGKMMTGWQVIGDSDYYLSPSSGKMTIGWKEIDGSWYYFTPEGQKQTGWQDDNGQTYHLGTDGKMMTGWQNLDNSWYYFNESGQRQTGVLDLNGATYYLDPTTGIMAANTTVTIQDIPYNADATGACTPVPEETAPTDSEPLNNTPPDNQAPDTPGNPENAIPKGPGEI